MSIEYCLRVINVKGLQWKRRLHSQVPDLYVEVNLGDDIKKTRTIKKSTSPTWNEPLIFSSSDESANFSIRVKHDSLWQRDPCVGYIDIKLADLLAKCADRECTFDLLSPTLQTPTPPAGSIVLHLQCLDRASIAGMMIETAGADVRGIVRSAGRSEIADSMNDGVTQLSNGSDLYQAIGQLMSRLDAFKDIVDVLSEIHPFLTVAWKLTSGLLQAISNVFKTDEKVVVLVHSMEDAFAFVHDVGIISERVRNLQQPIIGLLKQTIECCLFIREYASHGFLGRMLDIHSSQKVDEFEQSLSDFKKQIESGLIIHTAVVSLQVSQRIDSFMLRQLLNPSLTDAFDRPACLTGTRVEIQKRILEWIFSETDQNILWLHGVAGSGKSTVSMTIAEHLRDMSRLGAYLFFERGKSEPSSVIRTIAYKLALFDPSICSNILSEIDHDKDITMASSVNQFNKLLLQPLVSAARAMSGPTVVVLDALDECGTPESRRSLLQLFQRGFQKLPNNFRFFITSRREGDIDKVLSSQPGVVCTMELDYMSPASHQDVLTFLTKEMDRAVREQVKVPEDWPWEENMALLGRTAGGLFIWASTAVKLVSTSDNPFRSLKDLVSDSASVSNFGLDELYATVLRNSGIVWKNDTSRSRFEKVLGLLLLSKVPLSSETIDGVLGFPAEEPSLLVLSRLRCLLTYSQGQPVSLFHTSFSDYLMSLDRINEPWFIDISAQKHVIITRCSSVMEDLLHFNMCELETSFVRNDDVPRLEDRIKNNIPSHLEYVCLHWNQHLCDTQYSPDLLDILSDFTYRHILFWFEVLSLVKAFQRLASSALLDAATWTAAHQMDISSFLREAGKLASEFALPITQSTPHIYVSVIPLTKDESEVSAHYSRQMSSMVGVERRGIKRPPMWLKALEGHTDWVWSVAVSPDGSRIASASADRTIRVWDFTSGEEILTPLIGHSDEVLSVSFSPDGLRLVSGSADSTLRIWDVQDGILMLGPLKRHTDGVLSVSYSPDGKRIASGSYDRTVVIWDAAHGEVIAGPLVGHKDPVQSVTFSRDGTRVASGSRDMTVRIWNVESAELALAPFEGHTDWVMSVAFFPDGKRIFTGSIDTRIRIWDVENGRLVCGPLHGHTHGISSVACSPCGTRIASGSGDKTIVIWDVVSEEILFGPLEGHTDNILSVAYSPDGKHIVSGSADRTVRTWDSTPAEVDSVPRAGHRSVVRSVAFSADGSRIASASDDTTIMVWNAQTGEAIFGPLEGHTNGVNSITFSSDNSRLVSGSADQTIRIWNAENGEVVGDPLKGHTNTVWCIALSPDGAIFVSGSADDTIRVWDTASGILLAGPLHGHSSAVRSIAFSPNGKRLASGSYDETVRLWDTESWVTISEPLRRHTGWVYSVSFSADGTRIASGSKDKTIIIWDTETSQIVAGPFRGHTQFVMSVIFSLDGKYVFSGSSDRTIRVWSAETGQSICDPLEIHASDVMSLALSPNGGRFASGSWDNTVRVWDVPAILQSSERCSGDFTAAVASSFGNKNSPDWVLGGNGWILGGRNQNDLLLWIPPDLRRTL